MDSILQNHNYIESICCHNCHTLAEIDSNSLEIENFHTDDCPICNSWYLIDSPLVFRNPFYSCDKCGKKYLIILENLYECEICNENFYDAILNADISEYTINIIDYKKQILCDGIHKPFRFEI